MGRDSIKPKSHPPASQSGTSQTKGLAFKLDRRKTYNGKVNMITNKIRDISEVTVDKENNLIFEKNVSIPLKASNFPVRCNVYRPDAPEGTKFPVLVTYGPYGKDIPYDK